MVIEDENGINTKIWGPHFWFSLHCIVQGFPLNPTPELQKKYENFFILVGDVMPCIHCRTSYKKFIVTENTILNSDVLKNRKTLSHWLFLLHERVNKKLHRTYHMNEKEIYDRYESFRAPDKDDPQRPEKLKLAFENAFLQDFPVIPVEIAELFVPLAKKFQISEKYFLIYQQLKEIANQIPQEKNTTIWKLRNKLCQHLTRKIKLQQLPIVNTDKDYQGLPTRIELKLILLLCSYSDNAEILLTLQRLHL